MARRIILTKRIDMELSFEPNSVKSRRISKHRLISTLSCGSVHSRLLTSGYPNLICLVKAMTTLSVNATGYYPVPNETPRCRHSMMSRLVFPLPLSTFKPRVRRAIVTLEAALKAEMATFENPLESH